MQDLMIIQTFDTLDEAVAYCANINRNLQMRNARILKKLITGVKNTERLMLINSNLKPWQKRDTSSFTPQVKTELKVDRDQHIKKGLYFECHEAGHWAKDCLKRRTVNNVAEEPKDKPAAKGQKKAVTPHVVEVEDSSDESEN